MLNAKQYLYIYYAVESENIIIVLDTHGIAPLFSTCKVTKRFSIHLFLCMCYNVTLYLIVFFLICRV